MLLKNTRILSKHIFFRNNYTFKLFQNKNKRMCVRKSIGWKVRLERKLYI